MTADTTIGRGQLVGWLLHQLADHRYGTEAWELAEQLEAEGSGEVSGNQIGRWLTELQRHGLVESRPSRTSRSWHITARGRKLAGALR